MKFFNHTRPIRDKATKKIVGQKPAPCSRMTFAELGGQFGTDKNRRLVVTLKAGDVLEFRPERTRQTVTITAVDVYRFVLRCQAGRAQLEKARQRKIQKEEQRERRRIAAADRKLKAELRAERANSI